MPALAERTKIKETGNISSTTGLNFYLGQSGQYGFSDDLEVGS